MMRAVVSASQRGRFPRLLVTARGLDHAILEQLKLNHSSRTVVRTFASDDEKMKSSIGATPRGIIGNMNPSSGISGATNCEPIACGQAVAMANTGREDDSNKASKRTEITSQIHATPSLTECGKIGTDESYDKPCVEKLDNSKTAAAGNNFTDDAIKQLQDVATRLPSKEQVEKFFFRVVAFAYDVSFLTATWTIRFVNQNIAQNPTVQQYWKRFHEKMEQAKKD